MIFFFYKLATRNCHYHTPQTTEHLCQAARTVIHSAEITSQMLEDWINVDLNSIIKQTLYTMDSYSDREHNVIVKCKLQNLCSHSNALAIAAQCPI